MPQMAPYNWLMLFFLFNLIMIFIISYNQYMYMMNLSNLKKYTPPLKFSWVW